MARPSALPAASATARATSRNLGKGALLGSDFRQALAHRLGERSRARERADHHGQLADEPVVAELQEIEPVDLTIADARLEDQRARFVAVELLDVTEVLEDGRDRGEDRGDGIAPLVGLVHD